VRIRPLAAVSALALSALVLAGCSGSADPEESGSAAGDLCEVAAPSGAASEAVTVDGEPGEVSSASFDAGLEVTELERTVVSEGDGEELADGDLVQYALSAFSADTGDRLGDIGYAEGEVLPSTVTADSNLGQILGCAPVGSRLVVTFPPTEATETTAAVAAEVYILDVLGVTPTAAWGQEQEPVEGMPTVEIGEDGEPGITVPEGDAPTDVQLEVLKQGDGAIVEAGDNVLVQYTGVAWSDGSVFDSSWERGAPASFSTSGVVDGFRQALEGQAVGSQVVVVIPPEFGYGASEGHELQDETLVFVVDILATQHLAA
jgi:hypothetical protein